MKKSLLFVVLCLFLKTYTLQAQKIIATAGGHAASTSHQLSWTLGESIVNTHIAPDLNVTQGFHQSVIRLTALKTLNESIRLNLYPNPTTSYVNIDIDQTEDTENWIVQVSDIQGKQLLQKKVNSSEQLNFVNFAEGTYIITIQNQDKQILNSYKVIKK